MADDARLSTALPGHPKTVKLKRRLHAEGCWSLVCLFLWVADSRCDGNLEGLTVEDIEIAAKWEGELGAFVAALVEVGFLDGGDGAYRVHDWEVHNPWAAHRGERIAAARAAAKARWTKGVTPASVEDDLAHVDAPAMQTGCEPDAPAMQTGMPSSPRSPRTPPDALNLTESKPLAHSANELDGDASTDLPLDVESEPSEPPSKNATSDKRASTAKRSMLALGIYNRYPRKVAKDAALKAIGKAIAAVSKRGSAGAVGNEEAAAQWLGSRVDLYAKSAQARQPDKSKVPYPASWFNKGRYDDDEQEWNHVGLTRGGVRTYEMLDGNTAEDAGLTEVLSRPDPEWVERSSR